MKDQKPESTTINVCLIPMQSKAQITCDGTTGGTFQWKRHEFTLSLPPDCTNESVKLNMKAFLSNNLQVCEGVYIVSAVFNISASIKKLEKPAVLSFPHCIDIKTKSDIEKMKFYVQHENSFEIISGNFQIASSLGSVELTEFSKIFIVFFQHVGEMLRKGFQIVVLEDYFSDTSSNSHSTVTTHSSLPIVKSTENNTNGAHTMKIKTNSQDSPTTVDKPNHTQNVTASQQHTLTDKTLKSHGSNPNINYAEVLSLPKSCTKAGNWDAVYFVTHSIQTLIEVRMCMYYN